MSLPKELQERFDHVREHLFFDWDRQHYSILRTDTDADYIRLPSNKLLKVLGWDRFGCIQLVESLSTDYYESGTKIVGAEIDYTDHLG